MTSVPPSPTIRSMSLDQGNLARWDATVEHDRDVAIFDLLEANHFGLNQGPEGPYDVQLSLQDATLVFHIINSREETAELALSLRPLRKIVKDYFEMCETYFVAIRGDPPSRIEQIDNARRALHDEGAKKLLAALIDQVTMDRSTARRLFTLVCVLHRRD